MHVTSLQDLPTSVLGCVFSFLPTPDLGGVATTCKACNQAQKLEWLWKERCFSDLQYTVNHCSSWKEQYAQIIRNMRSGTAEVRQIPRDFCSVDSPFTLLDDGTSLAVCRDIRNPLLISVRNVENDALIYTIDMSTYGAILNSIIHGSLWTCLTENREIVSFNLLTGECEQRIPCQHLDLSLAKHHLNLSFAGGCRLTQFQCTEREIALLADKRVSIWDAQSGKLVQELPVEGVVHSWCITPNFVVYSTATDLRTGQVVQAIKRSDATVIEIDRCSYCRLTASDTHVAYVTDKGEVRVLVDEPEEGLIQKHCFSCPPGLWPRLSLGKKFLCVNSNGTFSFFDVYTGTRMGRIPGVLADHVVYKGPVIFARAASSGRCFDYLYDFAQSRPGSL
jgi:hypothetical protein